MNYKDVIKEIDGQIKQLAEARRVLAGLNIRGSGKGARKISAAGRRRIAAAQRKRWAKVRASKK
ncbi:MAG: hypothetical protein DMG80_12135 [Acidobacteria bacterium]|nr:MAG: hypothetical protein DMG80_12135 [Acidobacteriota bacterium]